MIAVFRYQVATVLHSQRYVAPFVFFLAMLAILTSSDSGPLLQTYIASAAATLACTVWLTVMVVGVEEPTGRSVLVVAAGSARTVLVATVATVFAFCLGLVAIGLVYPLYSGHHTVTAPTVAFGAVAEVTCAWVGIGIGLACSRLVVPRAGASTLLGLTLVLGALVVPGQPVSTMLRAMGGGYHGGRVVVFVVDSVLGLVVLGVGAALTEVVAARRD